MAQAQLPVSAYKVIRDFPLDRAERVWAKGATIRNYDKEEDAPIAPWNNETYKAAHAKHCAAEPGKCWVDQAELEHLIATSEPVPTAIENTTTPTSDRTITQELLSAGYRLKNMASTNEDGALEYNLAEQHLGVTPYEQPSPLTQRRIEWERRTKLSSDILTVRLKPINNVFQVAIYGVKLTDEQRLDFAKRYLARLKREFGGIPTLEQVQAFHATFHALREMGKKANLATLNPGSDKRYAATTYTEYDDDPTRDQFTMSDRELHDVTLITLEPDPMYDESGLEIPNTDKPEQRIILRTKQPALKALGYDPNDPFEQPDEQTLKSYYDSILPNRGDYLASTAAIGTANDLAMTEWDLGRELQDDPTPENLLALEDNSDPLSGLLD